MKAKTRFFGEIEIREDKLITMEKGMIGFPNYTHFGLIYDEEKGIEESKIMWLQCMDDGDIVFPVTIPTNIKEDYMPTVNEEIVAPLGSLTKENTFMLVTVTVPSNPEDFTVNLKAPIIINMDTLKGVQLIVEDDYPVKFKAYDVLKKEEKAGE